MPKTPFSRAGGEIEVKLKHGTRREAATRDQSRIGEIVLRHRLAP